MQNKLSILSSTNISDPYLRGKLGFYSLPESQQDWGHPNLREELVP